MFQYEKLISPLRIGNITLKSRMLFPNATPHFLQGPEPYPGEELIAFHSELARNGAAIISLAEWQDPDINKKAAGLARQLNFDLSIPANHNYHCQMTEDVHFYGSKIVVSATPDYPEGYSLNGKAMTRPGSFNRGEVELLPISMMDEVIDNFIKKLKLYKELGYDGYDMRAERYLYPHLKARHDEYDDSTIENRTRFLRRLCRSIKEELGQDFLSILVIHGEQPIGYRGGEKGYSLGDFVEFTTLLRGEVDIIQVREKDIAQAHPIGYNFQRGQHKVIEYCEAVKKAGSKVLLAPTGGFQDPDEMEALLEAGKCDMFGMARAFLADPEYGKKLWNGRGEDVVPCLWCNKCHGTMIDPPDPWVSTCSVNPKLGLYHKLNRMITPRSETPRKVAVIGGGPAGMEAAIVVAKRGNDVTLYEKTDHLGGQLIHGDYASFKWPVGDFKNYLIRQVKKLGVKVLLNTEPTPEALREEGYQAIFAATGAKPSVPNIPGLRDPAGKPIYPNCIDVYGHEQELGKRVVIIGGSENGVETAMYLCENGHDVTVLTRQKEIAHDASKLHYITMAFIGKRADGTEGDVAAWERVENLHSVVNAQTVLVEPGKVHYNVDGNEQVIETDSVVVCGGMKPALDEALQYVGICAHYFNIGDSNGTGNIQKCIRDAWSKASIL